MANDDIDLLRRYAAHRSEAAFGEIVGRYLNLVYRSALRRVGRDAHAAQDVAQEVFARLAQQAPRLTGLNSLAGWLFTTTRNVAAEFVRHEVRRRAREKEASIMEESRSPAPDSEWSRLQPIIDDVLDRLGERDRELVLLRHFHGGSFANIGARFGLSADAARFRVNRAMEKVRAALAKRGVVSSAAAVIVGLEGEAAWGAPSGMIAAVTRAALAKAALPAASSSVTVTTLQIMSTTKFAAAVALLVGCVAGGLLYREHAVLRSAQADLASSTRRAASLSRQVEEATTALRRAAADRDSAARRRAELARSRAAASKSAGVLAGDAAAGNRSAATVQKETALGRALSNDPAIRAAFSGWMKSAYAGMLGPFYQAARLSPQEISQLEDLLLERDTNMGVAYLTLRPDNVTPRQVEQDIHQLLGDGAYQQFQQYERTQYVNVIAGGLAAAIYDTGTPLSAEQGSQLTQIIAASAPQYGNGGTPFPSTVNWNAVLSQAQPILSSDQLAALKNESVILAGNSRPGGLNPSLPAALGNGAAPPAIIYSPENK